MDADDRRGPFRVYARGIEACFCEEKLAARFVLFLWLNNNETEFYIEGLKDICPVWKKLTDEQRVDCLRIAKS